VGWLCDLQRQLGSRFASYRAKVGTPAGQTSALPPFYLITTIAQQESTPKYSHMTKTALTARMYIRIGRKCNPRIRTKQTPRIACCPGHNSSARKSVLLVTGVSCKHTRHTNTKAKIYTRNHTHTYKHAYKHTLTHINTHTQEHKNPHATMLKIVRLT
jgi:hypothetical protein